MGYTSRHDIPPSSCHALDRDAGSRNTGSRDTASRDAGSRDTGRMTMTTRTRSARTATGLPVRARGSLLAAAASPGNVRRLFSMQSGLAPKAVLAAGISYLFLPIDLIPDRLPWVGHLDELGFLLLGFAGGLLLSVPPASHAGGRAPGLLGKWTQRLAWRTMRLGLAGALGQLALRLMLGRWPDPDELTAFCEGFDANAHGLPPLLRAAAYVPAARTLLNRAMLLSAQRSGTSARLGAAQMMGDPMTLWRGPPVRFLHLEKTAGSSLVNALTAQFHPLQIDPDPDRNAPPHERRPFPDATAGAQAGAALVWGHYDLPSLRRLEGQVVPGAVPCFTLCVFREPRARILSLYYYWRANQEDQAPTVRCARENGLLAFLRTRDPLILNYIDNLYVRRLTGSYATPDGDRLAGQPEKALGDALDAVDSLDLVGLSDRLDETLSRFGALTGFVPPLHTPRVNVLARSEGNAFLPYRPTVREPLTVEIEAELDRLTRLDRVVYRHAQQRSGLDAGQPAPAHSTAKA